MNYKFLTTEKLVKDASNLASFYGSHIAMHCWNRLCKTDWLGVGKDIKEALKIL